MNDIVEELNKEMQEERMRFLFVKYFPYLLAIIAIIMTVISSVLWRNSLIEIENEHATNIYLDYLESNSPQSVKLLSEDIIATKSPLAEFLYIFDKKNNQVNLKLLKDIYNLENKKFDEQNNIFNLSMKEHQIVQFIQQNNFSKAKEILNEMFKTEYIPGSMNIRLEALKLLIEEHN